MEKKEGVRNKPCEPCRARKVRCVPGENGRCLRCDAAGVECLFVTQSTRKQNRSAEDTEITDTGKRLRLSSSGSPAARESDIWTPFSNPFDGRNTELPRDSLLNQALGLSKMFHARHVGSSSAFPIGIKELAPQRTTYLSSTLRKVTGGEYYAIVPDTGTINHSREQENLAAIEACVKGHGLALINLYFRILHPSFPILERSVFLEKYLRSQQREFSPPCLAAVYIQALQWWEYGRFQNAQKPDERQLRALAQQTWHDVLTRPKLSTIQAGLLLAQCHDGLDFILLSQVTAVAYELGLHLDCSSWEIPSWEKGLRKRLAWSVFMQDKWSALILGRPSIIHHSNWHVAPVTAEDFPERAEDQDDQEGSTEVGKGRELFTQFIELGQIVAVILSNFYTLDARRELKIDGGSSLLMDRANTVHDLLDAWMKQLPLDLSIGLVQPRKLNSVGYLYVAYWAARASISRAVLQSAAETLRRLHDDVNNVSTSYDSALAVFESAISLVNHLRPEHLQSFWYFASSHSLALIASLGADLWSASLTAHERFQIKSRLEEYRWTLRVSAKSAGFMNAALETVNEILTIMEDAEHGYDSPLYARSSIDGNSASSVPRAESTKYLDAEIESPSAAFLDNFSFEAGAHDFHFDFFDAAFSAKDVMA